MTAAKLTALPATDADDDDNEDEGEDDENGASGAGSWATVNGQQATRTVLPSQLESVSRSRVAAKPQHRATVVGDSSDDDDDNDDDDDGDGASDAAGRNHDHPGAGTRAIPHLANDIAPASADSDSEHRSRPSRKRSSAHKRGMHVDVVSQFVCKEDKGM